MGGVFSSGPPPGVRDRRFVVHGSKWCDEEELLSRAKRIEKVSLITSGSDGGLSRIDWSDLVKISFLESPKRNSTWLDPILLCGAVQRKIGGAKLMVETKNSGSRSGLKHQLIFLDKNWAALEGLPSSIVKINKPSVELLKELVAKHPIVTSIRCTEHRGVEWTDEDASMSVMCGYNPQTLYCGDYDMNCIPRCALLVGYDKVSWTIFDPCFNFSFNVRRGEAPQTGVGEFALVPM